MELHNLVKMANQIGSYFESYPDQALARSEIAGHIERFWDPRMRKALLEQLDKAPTAGLSGLVADAVRGLRR